MEYVTFVARPRQWRLYRGRGDKGERLGERDNAPNIFQLSPAQVPLLWISGQNASGEETFVQRLTLPNLSAETIPWKGRRIGGLASHPEGRQVIALELPSEVAQSPRFQRWDGQNWEVISSEVTPDISSKALWLDANRLVYESGARQLTLLDVASGTTQVGPLGCCPWAASALGEWIALSQGRVVRFPMATPFGAGPTGVEGIDFDSPSGVQTTGDGQVFTWRENVGENISKGYYQQRGEPRRRFAALDNGQSLSVILGPYTWE